MKTKRVEKTHSGEAQAKANSNRIGDIALTAPINLTEGVKLNNVLAYLELRFSQAKKGDVNAAEALFQIAQCAASTVGMLFEFHEELLKPILRRMKPERLALMMERKSWPKRLTAQADTRPPNKTRSDASEAITELVQKMAEDLYREWKRHGGSEAQDDQDGASAKQLEKKVSPEFKKIMSSQGWKRMSGKTPIMGQTEAVKLLPTPSKDTWRDWWSLAEAVLSCKVRTKEKYWFLHPRILKLAGKPKDASQETARGTVILQYRNAFKQALLRVANSELQEKKRDDKQG